MKSSGSGKKKSAKSATTIGDFFPLKKSTTKNKRNKDEQERSGKKKIEEERKRVENMSNLHEGFSLDVDRCARVGCVGGGDFDLDDFDAFEKKTKSSSSKEEDKEEEEEEKETSFESEKKKKKMNENDCNTNAFTTLIQNQRLSECKKYLVLSFDEEEKWNVAFEKECFCRQSFIQRRNRAERNQSGSNARQL